MCRHQKRGTGVEEMCEVRKYYSIGIQDDDDDVDAFSLCKLEKSSLSSVVISHSVKAAATTMGGFIVILQTASLTLSGWSLTSSNVDDDGGGKDSSARLPSTYRLSCVVDTRFSGFFQVKLQPIFFFRSRR